MLPLRRRGGGSVEMLQLRGSRRRGLRPLLQLALQHHAACGGEGVCAKPCCGLGGCGALCRCSAGGLALPVQVWLRLIAVAGCAWELCLRRKWLMLRYAVVVGSQAEGRTSGHVSAGSTRSA